jgi:hypothetical protein
MTRSGEIKYYRGRRYKMNEQRQDDQIYPVTRLVAAAVIPFLVAAFIG